MKRAGKSLKSVSATGRWLTIPVIALSLQGAWLGITCRCEQSAVRAAPAGKDAFVPTTPLETHCGEEHDAPITAGEPSGTTPADPLETSGRCIAEGRRHSCVVCCSVEQQAEVYDTQSTLQKAAPAKGARATVGTLAGSRVLLSFFGLPPPPRSCPAYLAGSALLI